MLSRAKDVFEACSKDNEQPFGLLCHYLVASADLESFVVLFNMAFDDENIEDLALVILE
jgi:hypothetical protein